MRLLVEVTETFESQLNTGIQRVVRRVCRELFALQDEHDFEVHFVVSSRADRSKGLFINPGDIIPSLPTEDESRIAVWNAPQYKAFAWLWKRLEVLGLRRALGSRIVQKTAERLVRKIHINQISKLPDLQFVSFQSGDVFLVIDAFWGNDEGLKLAEQAKSKGAVVVTLINDVFPLSHPQFCDANNVKKFEAHVERALRMADLVLYPSDATRADIEINLPGVLGNRPHVKVPYGHDGVSSTADSAVLGAPLRIPNSICVLGTVEPRKNLDLVVGWFMQHGRHTNKLTVIGKPGWMTESLQKLMRHEARFNDLFTWHEAADDDLLLFELARHEIGIMASHAEGFGLPVVEMAESGLKLVLSDIPIFHEVAGEAADYFDPSSISSLADAISAAETRLESGRIERKIWADTAIAVVEAIKLQGR